ncbi:MAG: hypothetical protein JSS27_08825 [Planctomycetes bacterium]|nr:hypothetical protein [Planctomycetota bacterium]
MRQLKTFVTGCLSIALLLASSVVARAEQKPLVVVSFAGYEALRGDVDFLGKSADYPELVQSLDGIVAMFTQMQGLQGLDKTKPWGYVLTAEEGGFPQFGFLPVTNLDKLLGALVGMVGQPQDVGDGVKSVTVNGMPIFLKPKGKLVFVASNSDDLNKVPEDPMAWLGNLPKEYDLAVQANVQNVPPQLRQMFMDQIKLGLQQGLKKGDDESDEQFKARGKLAEEQMAQLDRVANELEQVTVGYSLSPEKKNATIDLVLTAVSGSSLAKELAAQPNTGASKFAGFLTSDVLANGHWNAVSSEESRKQSAATFESLRQSAEQSIDASDELSDEEKPDVKELVGELIAVAKATAEKGLANGGFVITGEGPFTIVAGGAVAEGNRLDKAIRKAVARAKKKGKLGDDVEISLDDEEYKGIKFHTLDAPWPESDDDDTAEQIEELLGDEINIVVGVSDNAVYFALGEDGSDAIKKVIDGSASAPSPKLPAQVTVALTPILDYLADQDEDNKQLAQIAKELDEFGKDKINLTVDYVPNGQRVRYELQEGVLRAIGLGAKAAQQRGQ